MDFLLHFVSRFIRSFVLTQKNQKVKAVHPSLENYIPFRCLHPNSQTSFTDSFAKNPMTELKQGFDYSSFHFVLLRDGRNAVKSSSQKVSSIDRI